MDLASQKLERFLWLIPKEVTPVFQWHHGVVIDGLLRGGKASLALGYIENFGSQMQTVDDVKAKIEVFVYNQKFDAAHELLVCNSSHCANALLFVVQLSELLYWKPFFND